MPAEDEDGASEEVRHRGDHKYAPPYHLHRVVEDEDEAEGQKKLISDIQVIDIPEEKPFHDQAYQGDPEKA